MDYVPLYIWDNGEGATNRYEIVDIDEALKTETDAERIATLKAAKNNLQNNTNSSFARAGS